MPISSTTHCPQPPPPLRVARGPHLLDVSAPWGPASGLHRMLSARHAVLTGLGWRYTVMAPGATGSGLIDSGGVALPWTDGHRLPLGRERLVQLIERSRPDLIEVADAGTLAWAALEAGQRLGLPTMAFCHSNLAALAARLVGGSDGLGTRRGRWAARCAQAYVANPYAGFDRVLAPSQGMVQRLRQWGLRHVQHQPLGVDCAIFNAELADPLVRRRIMRHLCVPSGTRLLVYTGRFESGKHLDKLAEAVDLLGPGHLLVAAGAGPRPPRGKRVRLLPTITDARRLARLLANADVYVHAGDQDTCSPGALEAMACGLPVVLSAADGLRELAGVGGLAVPERRPQEWAEAIACALASNLETLRGQALAHARAHDWPLVLNQMVQRYRRMLAHAAGQRAGVRPQPDDALVGAPVSLFTPAADAPRSAGPRSGEAAGARVLAR